MTIYLDKDRGRWRYDFLRGGKRHAGYCMTVGAPDEFAATKTAARQWEEHVKATITRAPGQAVPAAVAAFTLAQAMAALMVRVKGTPNWVNVQDYIAELVAFFGPDRPVEDIDETSIWGYVEWARTQRKRIYIGGPRKAGDQRADRPLHRLADECRSDSTINRYLVYLGRALRIAAKTRNPETGRMMLATVPEIPHLDVPEATPNPISDKDLLRIVAAAPEHLADAVMLARLMGFRRGEMFALSIDQVDLDNKGVWLEGSMTKSGRPEFMHASPAAMKILARRKAGAFEHKLDCLFWYQRGKKGVPAPMRNPKTAWARVMKDLGLAHRFHDTKASLTTALGTKVSGRLTQELSRHKDASTTDRYIKFADPAKRAAINAVGRVGPAAVDAPVPTLNSHTPAKTKRATGPK